MKKFLRKANSPRACSLVGEKPTIFYKVFKNKDVERLRSKFMRLNVFQESWIPILKSGSYKRFELYDLATDPGQQNDLSAQLPDVAARLKKKLLEINASVHGRGA